jgi:hypothetical protein
MPLFVWTLDPDLDSFYDPATGSGRAAAEETNKRCRQGDDSIVSLISTTTRKASSIGYLLSQV